MGLDGPRLDAAELLKTACRTAGLDDFGEWEIRSPLDALIDSYEQDANLNPFGRIAARWDLLRFLNNLLQMRAEEKKHPEILDQRIDKPIFIAGLPRSGTSFLHELLSADPQSLAVRCWETIYPCALDLACASDRDIARRRRKVAQQLAMFEWIAPEIRHLHPISADSPQECTEITGHVFLGMRFDSTHRIPSYRRWLDGRDLVPAYRFHKRFLQHLQYHRGAGQWVLKCPDHVFALDALRQVYPDARFVFCHRSPLAVLPSVARLTEVIRHPFTSHLDRREIGTEVSERWALGAKILVEDACSLAGMSEPSFHLTFDRFVRDPAAAVEAVYQHFGIYRDPESAARIRRLVSERPGGGNGPNRGRLADYGLDATVLRGRFRDYAQCFGLMLA